MSIPGILVTLAVAVIAFLVGWIINSFLGKDSLKKSTDKSKKIIQEAQDEADNLKKEKLIEAEEEIYQLRQKAEDEYKNKKNSLKSVENELTIREGNLDRKADLVSKKKREIFLLQRDIQQRETHLNIRQEKLDRLMDEENKRLETISGLTRDEAKKILMDNLIESAKKDAAGQVYKIMDDAQKDAQAKAKNIIISAMQQTAADHAVESTVSIVSLPSDDMKGRIIGREGRNIRAFEIVTGVDVIVDDTPEAVILSGYDPYRRELARITMEKLVNDGRIHPGRIEETYEKTKQEMQQYFTELGEQALLETGIHGVQGEVAKMLGKLRFRTSYGQNVLQHSKEVALIAGIMAAELDLDETIAKRAGMLHDIGRAVDKHGEGNHCQLGYDFVKKFGEHPIVLNAILAHHGEVEAISPISILVQVANEISRSRPGARRDVIENFVKRMNSFEEIAQAFEGVNNAYAIQAGKEVRIIVNHEKVDDPSSFVLATDIAKKIQSQVDYPGQIKVVVIRELRSIDYA